jgi:RPA family protein
MSADRKKAKPLTTKGAKEHKREIGKAKPSPLIILIGKSKAYRDKRGSCTVTIRPKSTALTG